jgi:ribosome maturation factor RimP
MARIEALSQIIEPAVEALDFELWGVEYVTQDKRNILRVFIDHSDGVTIDSCAKVSHQISGVLDVEDPIVENYHLEVSSPGLDRPLFNINHFITSIGKRVKVRSGVPVLGRRNFTGKIESVVEEVITIEVDGELYEVHFNDVDKANIVPQF